MPEEMVVGMDCTEYMNARGCEVREFWPETTILPPPIRELIFLGRPKT